MTLHINRPSSTRFQARVRGAGQRKYKLVGKPTREMRTAILRMSKEFAGSSLWKRGDVIIFADYYDPQICCELKRT